MDYGFVETQTTFIQNRRPKMDTLNNANRQALIVRTAAAMIFCLLFSLSAVADDHPRLDRMTEHLELSESQSAEIGSLIEAHRDRMAILRQNHDEQGRQSNRHVARAERQALIEEIETVLDEQQRERFQQIRDRQRDRRPRQSRRLMHAVSSLDLSREQQIAVRLLMEQKRAEHQAQRIEFKAELATILNEDQLAQLKSITERQRERS